jgi:hypothetical protein
MYGEKYHDVACTSFQQRNAHNVLRSLSDIIHYSLDSPYLFPCLLILSRPHSPSFSADNSTPPSLAHKYSHSPH